MWWRSLAIRTTLIMPCLLAAAACAPGEFVWSPEPVSALDTYLRSFRDAVGAVPGPPRSRADTLAVLPDTRVLWLGDHHTNRELHRLQRELLDGVTLRGRRVVLMLEAIGTQDQPQIERWLHGAIRFDELRLRLRRRWADSWLDDDSLDAAHYRELCLLAKRRGWSLTGLEPTPRPPLAVRDERIAARVAAIAAAEPDALLVVVIGHAHLVGDGDCIARTELPSLAFGGEPPKALATAAAAVPGAVRRGAAGLWWFGELFTGPTELAGEAMLSSGSARPSVR
jgi:hypothetical protein